MPFFGKSRPRALGMTEPRGTAKALRLAFAVPCSIKYKEFYMVLYSHRINSYIKEITLAIDTLAIYRTDDIEEALLVSPAFAKFLVEYLPPDLQLEAVCYV